MVRDMTYLSTRGAAFRKEVLSPFSVKNIGSSRYKDVWTRTETARDLTGEVAVKRSKSVCDGKRREKE
jgi:hypothetical protein